MRDTRIGREDCTAVSPLYTNTKYVRHLMHAINGMVQARRVIVLMKLTTAKHRGRLLQLYQVFNTGRVLWRTYREI